MSRYKLSEEAQNDLREIQHYTRVSWGNNQAKRYLIELTASFEKLANTPKLGITREELAKDLRSFQTSHHILFYRESSDGIEIARVLHHSMDIKRRQL